MRTLTFCGLTITWDERVLEPRPWTEHQSRWAADLLTTAPPGPVLELCSRAGHIGLGAVEATDRHLVMVDVNPAAGDLALENARANGLGSRVEVRVERLEEALTVGERFPLILADPPWVPSADTALFPTDPAGGRDTDPRAGGAGAAGPVATSALPGSGSGSVFPPPPVMPSIGPASEWHSGPRGPGR